MPAKKSAGSSKKQTDWSQECLVFLCGEDDFSIERKASEILQSWDAKNEDECEFELIDGRVQNASEARNCLSQFLSAMQTLPFFASKKVIFLKKATFLGDDRTSSTKDVSEFLLQILSELEAVPPESVKILWTAGKVDKRKAFYKKIGKLATSEVLDGWSARSRNWQNEARSFIRSEFNIQGKRISSEAIDFLVEFGGGNPRQLAMEIEKIALFAGPDHTEIDIPLIRQVAVRTKEAEAFMLAEAVGQKNLKSALALLDKEMASMASDKSKSVIAILYSLISKTRCLIFAEALKNKGYVNSGMSYQSFKGVVESLPDSELSQDPKWNPKSMPLYGLYLACQQTWAYQIDQLVRMLESFLQANLQLVSSSVDPLYLLQTTLIKNINDS